MHRARAAGTRMGPRDPALDREVDLERARAVPEPSVGAAHPGGQPVAEDVGDRARRQVEHGHVGRRQVGDRPRPAPRSRSCRRARPAAAAIASVIDREPPSATAQPCRCPAVRMPSPIAEVSGRCSGWKACAATPANSARASSVRNSLAEHGRGQHGGQPNRASVSGWRGHPQQRAA